MGVWAAGISGYAVITSVIISQLVIYTQSIYLHRCLAHRTVDLSPSTRFMFRAIVWLFFGSDPREWVATHRLHHAFADTERDPHRPLIAGFWTVALLGGKLVREACRDRDRMHRLTRDLPTDVFERLPVGRRYGGIALAFLAIVLIAGPVAALWIYGLTVAQILAGTTIVNVLGHLPGPGVTGHIGRNLPLFAPFTAGEALHANHHAAPGSVRLRVRKGEVDPGWRLIQILAKLGLARVRTTTLRQPAVILA